MAAEGEVAAKATEATCALAVEGEVAAKAAKATNALAAEVRALSTKLDMALNAIAELSKQQKH